MFYEVKGKYDEGKTLEDPSKSNRTTRLVEYSENCSIYVYMSERFQMNIIRFFQIKAQNFLLFSKTQYSSL